MGVWSNIIIEAYCMYNSLSKKTFVTYELLDKKISKTPKKYINVNYISSTKRPKWCVKNNKKKIPNYKCLCSTDGVMCPFFGYTNADKKTYKLLEEK